MSALRLDARWLDTGIGTYTLNLMRELRKVGVNFGIITQRRHRTEIPPEISDVEYVDAGMYSVREQVQIPWASRGDAVLHALHYNAPLIRSEALLVTIHDLTHILDESHRGTWKSRFYARPMLSMVSQRAEHLFTVSEYSRRQIAEHLGVDPAKITSVYNGVSQDFYPEPRRESQTEISRLCGFEGPYILFVGSLKSHKNIAGLIKSYALLRERHNVPHKLMIVGSGEDGFLESRETARVSGVASDVVFHHGLSVSQLRRAYSGADLTVLPSFEEGFGLPVIESMACGTPVACSNVASLPEVGGGAASYFDPRDVESMAASIVGVLESPGRWEKCQQSGFENARRFTWPECAQKHIEVYRRYVPASCFTA